MSGDVLRTARRLYVPAENAGRFQVRKSAVMVGSGPLHAGSRTDEEIEVQQRVTVPRGSLQCESDRRHPCAGLLKTGGVAGDRHQYNTKKRLVHEVNRKTASAVDRFVFCGFKAHWIETLGSHTYLGSD